mgnify:CR=1 FL=1
MLNLLFLFLLLLPKQVVFIERSGDDRQRPRAGRARVLRVRHRRVGACRAAGDRGAVAQPNALVVRPSGPHRRPGGGRELERRPRARHNGALGLDGGRGRKRRGVDYVLTTTPSNGHDSTIEPPDRPALPAKAPQPMIGQPFI